MGALTTLGYLAFSTSNGGAGGSGDGVGEITNPGVIASSAYAMAASVFTGYAKNLSADQLPERVASASYYYSLQQIAVRYIALRQGNIGSAAGGKVARTILAKADGLLKIARDGIALWENFCATEAATYGANMAYGDGEMTVLQDGVSLDAATKAVHANGVKSAESYTKLIAADFKTADLPMGYIGNWNTYGGYGYALKAQSSRLLNRLPTVSDARNPQIGAYYQSMAGALGMAGKAITDTFETVVKAQKVQFAVSKSGL